jgi:hypothetical protein
MCLISDWPDTGFSLPDILLISRSINITRQFITGIFQKKITFEQKIRSDIWYGICIQPHRISGFWISRISDQISTVPYIAFLLKGTVARDFRPFVFFFIHQPHLGPWNFVTEDSLSPKYTVKCLQVQRIWPMRDPSSFTSSQRRSWETVWLLNIYSVTWCLRWGLFQFCGFASTRTFRRCREHDRLP